ncbi:MAG: chemotaxis protein CheC [Acidobacteria bacterium]|nr:chemotaxis protein CheC [Acidobacteriota bacterium]
MLFCDLDNRQVDALREVGNIGAGHAATALSQLVGRSVSLSVPKVDVVPFPRICALLGGPETEVAALYMKVYGDTRGNILIVFSPDNLATLAGQMLGKPVSSVHSLSALERSAMLELGNILSSAYLTSISQLLHLSLIPSVPSLAIDMVGAILEAPILEISRVADTALVLQTEFQDTNNAFAGHFFLLPDPQSLDTMLDALSRS